MPYDELRQKMAQFGEEPVARGMVSEDAALVIWARRDGETWTLLSLRADGTACVIAVGGAFSLSKWARKGMEG